jgi:hypothetical protein
MKKEKQKLAVEWLETRAEEREKNNPNESAYWHLRELIKDFEQAKEMDKQAHQETWDGAHQAGRFEGKGIAEENWWTFEEYWEENFKQQQNL